MRYLLPLLALLLVALPAQAAISFVDSANNTAADGGDVTVTMPAGAAEDDIVIFIGGISVDDNTDLTMAMTTSGYTKVADLFVSETNRDINFGAWWKVMGATPDSTAVMTGSSNVDYASVGVLMVFSGVDTATPMDVTPTTATGQDTWDANPPSINYDDASAWVVIGAASVHTRGGGVTYTFPTGYTTNADSITSNDTTDALGGIGYNSSPSDPEDPGAMTGTGAADDLTFGWAAVTIALREAGAAATGGLLGIDLAGGVSKQ